jgi:thiol-disulfide isomerase/thioredoxin
MRYTKTVLLTAAVAVLAVGVGVWTSLRTEAAAAAAPGAASALFYQQTLADAAGVPHAMKAYRGQAVVINFWATWCVPCVKEIPTFSKVHADAGGKVAFVGLGIDSPDNIRAFDARFGPSYPLLAAGASGTDLARAFGNDGGALPFTVVLDRTGRVVASHLGQVDEATLRQWIATVATADKRS